MIKTLLKFAALLSLLAGCATVPPVNVRQPMTARPVPPAEAPGGNGAIYQAGYTNRPLFEDRRARNVGDTLIITINEVISASKKSSSSASRTGSDTMSVPILGALSGSNILKSALSASSANAFAGKGDSASNNAFNGTIAVTVVEVLSNGNLIVSGEKQIGINQGGEYVRFSGVVNPNSISSSNSVSSTQVADARMEYKGTGYIDEAQTMGWLARFFMSVAPF